MPSRDWVRPSVSKNQVKRAGKLIVDDNVTQEERAAALSVVNHWRSAHAYPLNSLQMSLRAKVRSVAGSGIVGQRLKRLPSIESKLQRFPQMSLASMQDLGGCRAVLEDVRTVREVSRRFLESSHQHVLVGAPYDYIAAPKPSGYRGIHLVYSFRSRGYPDWDGLLIEVQLRTKLQHAWATAVETVGLFNGEALKASRGDEQWLRFFAFMGSEIAILEGETLVPGTPSDSLPRHEELRTLATELDVDARLSAYAAALSVVGDQMEGAPYYVLTLDTFSYELSFVGYHTLEAATETYDQLEQRSTPNQDIVLVRADGVAGLRQAFPNYFADTRLFMDILLDALEVER